MIWTTAADETSLADASPGDRGGGASNASQAGHTRTCVKGDDSIRRERRKR